MSFYLATRLPCHRSIRLAVVAAFLLAVRLRLRSQGGRYAARSDPRERKGHFQGRAAHERSGPLEPDDYGRPASGKLQPDGSFVLTTTKEGDGVVPGHHRVTITDTTLNAPKRSPALLKKYARSLSGKFQADVAEDKTDFVFAIE